MRSPPRRTVRTSLLRYSAAAALALVAAVPACEGGSTVVADLTRRTSPFDRLQHVRLGMTAGDLQRARPHARPAPYLGYDEELGEYRIDYQFPGSYSEEQVVPESSRLKGITAVRKLSTTREAADAWRQKVQDMARRLGREPECFNVVRGGVHGATAVWKREGTTIRAEFLEGYVSRSVGGQRPVPPSLRVEIEKPGWLDRAWKRVFPGSTAGVSLTPEACSRAGPPPPPSAP